MTDDVKKRWTSRKLILCALVAVMAFVALLLDQVGETIFRDLVLGALGLYTAGNVGQKYVIKETTP